MDDKQQKAKAIVDAIQRRQGREADHFHSITDRQVRLDGKKSAAPIV